MFERENSLVAVGNQRDAQRKAQRSAARKSPDEMVPIIEDLMKLLDDVSDAYRRGKHPDPKEARQIAGLLNAVAKDIEP